MFSTMKMPEDMLPTYNSSKNVATEALEAAHARSNGGSAIYGGGGGYGGYGGGGGPTGAGGPDGM